jgi:hypothetical protein
MIKSLEEELEQSRKATTASATLEVELQKKAEEKEREMDELADKLSEASSKLLTRRRKENELEDQVKDLKAEIERVQFDNKSLSEVRVSSLQYRGECSKLAFLQAAKNMQAKKSAARPPSPTPLKAAAGRSDVSETLQRTSLDADPHKQTATPTPKSTSAPQSASKRKAGEIARPLSSGTGPIIGKSMFRILIASRVFFDIRSTLSAGSSLLILVCRSIRRCPSPPAVFENTLAPSQTQTITIDLSGNENHGTEVVSTANSSFRECTRRG